MKDTADPGLLNNPLPQRWRRTTLGDIGEYINGRGFKKSEWSDKGLPIVRIQNLTGSSSEQNYYEGDIEERHIVEPGDLLISWAATLGAYIWPGPRAAVNQHIFKVRSFIDKKLHYYLTRHILDDLYRQAHGSGMVHITKSKFDATPVLIPEMGELQKQVVAEIEKQFSRLDKAVVNLKRIKVNLKRYKAAVLKAAVEGRLVETEALIAKREGRSYETGEQLLARITEARRHQWKVRGRYKEPAAPNVTQLSEVPDAWTVSSLSALLDEPLRNGHSAKATSDPNGLRAFTLSAVTKGDFSEANTKLTVAQPEKVATLWAQPGDIYIERSNTPELVGTARLYRGPANFAFIPDLLIRIRLCNQVLPEFVEIALSSNFGRNYFRAHAQGISGTMPKIDQSIIESFAVLLPPIEEQRRIVAETERRLSIVNEIENQIDTNLKRAKHMRQAVLARMFDGQAQ